MKHLIVIIGEPQEGTMSTSTKALYEAAQTMACSIYAIGFYCWLEDKGGLHIYSVINFDALFPSTYVISDDLAKFNGSACTP